MIAPYVLHRHRLLWDQPDLFDPSRFLMGAARKILRGAYVAFGVGARMRLGASFAHQEATIALASLVKNFDLRMTPGQSVWPQQGITLRPRDPLLMTARARGQPRVGRAPGGRRERAGAMEIVPSGNPCDRLCCGRVFRAATLDSREEGSRCLRDTGPEVVGSFEPSSLTISLS